MRILVIGGTRFIGAAAVRQLRARGHEVAVLNRGRNPDDLPPDVVRIVGDRDDLSASHAALRRFDPDVALHMVVGNRKHAESAQEVLRGTVDRLVLASSMDVYRAYARLNETEPGPLEPMPQDEDAPLRERLYPYRSQTKDSSDPRWEYDKIPAEKVVLGDPDLPGTVLRLPMVLGPGDYQHRLFPIIKPMIDQREAIVLQRAYAHWQSTYGYVDNVGEALAVACEDERAAGRTYNVADRALSVLELHGHVARTLNWHGDFVLLPRDELPESLVPPWRVEQSLVGSAERIRGELAYEPVIDLKEGIARTVAWERDHPPDPMPDDLGDYTDEDAVLARL